MEFRVFTMGKEFVGSADVHHTPGRFNVAPEDCYPAESDVEVTEIFLRFGSKTKEIQFDHMASKAQDKIISEIQDDYSDACRKQYNEDRYDR